MNPFRGHGTLASGRSGPLLRHSQVTVHEYGGGLVPPVEISTDGMVSESERAYAVEKVGRVLDTLSEPALHTRIRLDRAGDPAREHPAQARVTIDVNGRPIRAHVAAGTMTEAIDILQARLRHRLERVAEHRRALQRRGAASPTGEWRHGDPPTPRGPHFPRPVEEREVVSHKTFSTADSTVDEAIFDLEAMDYDFFMFTDTDRRQDAVVYRRPDGSYGLQYLDGGDRASAPTVARLAIRQRAAPQLTLDEAIEHLDEEDDPWVFFRDTANGHGHVLYRRYDGHYGLITPIEARP
jgi:ribosome-associated translation inhibitor RaiA